MFRKFHVKKDERGLLFRKGDFVRVLHPGEHLVFDPLLRHKVEMFALEKPLFDHRLAEYIRMAEPELAAREFHVVEIGPAHVEGQGAAGGRARLAVIVPQYHAGVLYVEGKVEKLLEAGLHAFWMFRRDVHTEVVDLRLQSLEVAGQEILTRDKVTLRVNLNAGYRVTDVLVAYAKQAKRWRASE